ncbi:MAG TPA: putative quinol monooxygenase [Verrucomicrobiae bacterium]|nr:putative quinol monooxygenase [Verrucomicrobiae bacterium]
MNDKPSDNIKLQIKNEKSISVLAFMEAKEGKVQELIKHVLSIVAPTRKEEGNIAFVPCIYLDNSNQIMVDEIWASKEALDNHFNTDHMKDISPKIQPILTKPLEIRIYKEVTQ